MRINIPPGRYVAAISGGVDSMVMLDLLRHHDDLEVIVAHFDHGIRADSSQDENLVRACAESLGLRYETERAELGEGASEDSARVARYAFLNKICKKYRAESILTAHHQDDLIETAIINLLRGTGRLGLNSLRNRPGLERPLLPFRKQEIINYAKANNLKWREDSTNKSNDYLRNRVRKLLGEKADDAWRQSFLAQLQKISEVNDRLDAELAPVIKRLTGRHGATMSRSLLVKLNHVLACELVAGLLRQSGIRDLSSSVIERVVVAAKTLRPGKKLDLDKQHRLIVTKRSVRIIKTESKKTLRV